VDRRVVVDQATAEAEKIAHALRPGQKGTIVQDIRERLGLRPEQELLVSTLRGGRADDRAWTYDAAAPAIVIGTIDLIGSRLLFSGYRMSRWSRSMHAGLVGADSLIVLDEAHLSPAFDQAVRRVLYLRAQTSGALVPAMRFLRLSATLDESDAADIFCLEPADYEDPIVSRRTGRFLPTKKLNVEPFSSGKSALVDALAERSVQFDGGIRAVLIYCTSRAAANATADKLYKALGKGREGDVGLLTGARRGQERDQLVRTTTYRAFTYKNGVRDLPEDGRTRFLVCTAAGEVGADLDAEAAVMDLVPLERMIQRLGRVNRRGACAAPAPVTVYYDPAALNASASEKDERKRGEAARLSATKAALERLLHLNGNSLDASPYRLGMIDIDERKAASTPPPEIPAVEREHVEAWALTSLEDHPGRPEVAPFLRGIIEEEPQTTVAWRADVALLARLPNTAIKKAMAAARLKPAEVLEVPTRDIADVLIKRIKSLRKDWGKVEDGPAVVSQSAHLLLFRGGKLIGRGEITPDQAVLTVASGGEDRAIFLDEDAKSVVQELGNATLLLEPAIGALDEGGALADCKERPGLHVQPDIVIRRVWRKVADSEGKAPEVLAAPARLVEKHGKDALREMTASTSRQLGLRRAWSAELPGATEDEDGPVLEYWKWWDMDGETGATSSRPQTLKEHHEWAEEEMRCLAKRLGLPASLAEALIRSIAVHDLGKDRAQWQNGVGAPRDSRPYAKSDGRGPGVRNYRHEFGSLRDVLYKKPSSLDGLEGDLRELVLHLIASHHGRARPSILAEDDEEIFENVLDQDALDAAVRYVRLQRHWGPWGLAWLEALFRTVDATISRRLENENRSAEAGKPKALG
jgi:CRISPR-associated endonuclease/helicase Cas3